MAKQKTAKPAVGAPTKYRPEMPEQAEKLCRLGATDAEMADFFGVVESTLNEWKLLHLEFSESIKRGKIESDANVSDRLYQRAMGYSHPSEKVFNHQGEILRADVTEHYPPDTAAAIFWLKNRQPSKWRDKIQQEITGQDGSPLVPRKVEIEFIDGPAERPDQASTT